MCNIWLKSVKSYMNINPNSEFPTTKLWHMWYLSVSTDHPALFEIGFDDPTCSVSIYRYIFQIWREYQSKMLRIRRGKIKESLQISSLGSKLFIVHRTNPLSDGIPTESWKKSWILTFSIFPTSGSWNSIFQLPDWFPQDFYDYHLSLTFFHVL